jgi:hypothetical protein
MIRSVALATLALCLLPATSRADDVEYRVSPYLLVAGGGDVKTNFSNTSDGVTTAANASVGFGARFEAAITEYIAVGALFEYAALQRAGATFPIVGTVTPDRDKLMDFDVWVKGGTRLDLGPGELEVYGGVPFGLTAAVVTFSGDRETLPGYNLGLLAGAQYWFDRFGVFTELGYRFHKVFDRSVLGSDVQASYRISQLAWHLGGSVAF